MLSIIKEKLANLAAGSPWVYRINTGSCNACDVEVATTVLCPRYDLSRFGVRIAGSPKHADIVVITGPVTERCKGAVLRILEQVPEPRVILTIGNCPASGNVYQGSYSLAGPVSEIIPVDVSVLGCPPSPWAIIDGVVKAKEIWKKKLGEIVNK